MWSRSLLAASAANDELFAIWSPDGTTVLVVSGPGIWLYNANNPTSQPRLLTSKGDQFTSLAISPNGALIAGGTDTGKIDLWDARTGEQRPGIQAHSEQVSGLAFTAGGTVLASAGWEGSLRLWDVGSGQIFAVSTLR